MAILTVADVQHLCLGNQSSDSLQNLMAQAQSIAEGPQGAHRPLEKLAHKEIIPVGSTGVGRITRLPVVTAEPVVVELKGEYQSGTFGLSTAGVRWITLAKDKDYTFEADTGEIRLVGLAHSTYLAGLTNQIEAYSFAGNWTRRPRRQRRNGPKIRASYTTGWDFQSGSLDYAGKTIKATVAAILQLLPDLNRSRTEQGLVGIANAAYDMKNIQAQLERHLVVLRQWRPKEFA